MLKYAREKNLYSNANFKARTSYRTNGAIMGQLGKVFICSYYHFFLFVVTSYKLRTISKEIFKEQLGVC